MKKDIVVSIKMLLVFIVLCGGIYTLAVTGIGQLFFSEKANGSLVLEGEKVRGSSLIGQTFTSSEYFQGRPGVSQLSPVSAEQKELVAKRTKALQKENPNAVSPVPIDLVTGSASGVDPEISEAAAYYQAERIASARKVNVQKVNDIIEGNTIKVAKVIGGTARVNVLQLNLKLDEELK